MKQIVIPSAARVAVLDEQNTAYEKPNVLYTNRIFDLANGQGIEYSTRFTAYGEYGFKSEI